MKIFFKCNPTKIKTKKCQPAARDRPDLIQTAPVPDSWLARQIKINRTKNFENTKNCGKWTENRVKIFFKSNPTNIKTKKCQPAARDRPDLIQTAPVPDSWLARQIKINRTKNFENTKNSGKWTENRVKIFFKSNQTNIKTKKCQPAARDRPDLIQTAPVPDSWLARQIKINRTKKLKLKKKWQLGRKLP